MSQAVSEPLYTSRTTVSHTQQRQSQTWLCPSLRIIDNVSSPQFPKDPNKAEWRAILKTLSGFARVCIRSRELLLMIAPEQMLLLDLVIGQYCRVVLEPGMEWLEHKRPKNSNIDVSDYKDMTDVRDLVSPQTSSEWYSQTVFDVVFAALAWRYGAGAGMDRRIQADAGEVVVVFKLWQDSIKRFRPFAVTFDIGAQIVGTSCAGWNKREWLNSWEQSIRDARFASEVCSHLTRVERKLQPMIDNHDLESEQQIKDAVALLREQSSSDDLCQQLCGLRQWHTIKTEHFQTLGPVCFVPCVL